MRAATSVQPDPDVIASLNHDFQPTTAAEKAAVLTIAIGVARWFIIEDLERRFMQSACAGELDVGQIASRWVTLCRYDGAMNLAMDRAFNLLMFESNPDSWRRLEAAQTADSKPVSSPPGTRNQQHRQLRSCRKPSRPDEPRFEASPVPESTTSPAPFVKKSSRPEPARNALTPDPCPLTPSHLEAQFTNRQGSAQGPTEPQLRKIQPAPTRPRCADP
ncbi:MAG TPA: hypothetical protein VFA04_26535 [Bryobacteraceae bacterium]|nr:hypothetical protein [Bryobacteraceae bacterium]